MVFRKKTSARLPRHQPLDLCKMELRWLYKNCPAWGGHLERGEPLQLHSQLYSYVADGFIEAKYGGYYLTQRGIDHAFK